MSRSALPCVPSTLKSAIQVIFTTDNVPGWDSLCCIVHIANLSFSTYVLHSAIGRPKRESETILGSTGQLSSWCGSMQMLVDDVSFATFFLQSYPRFKIHNSHPSDVQVVMFKGWVWWKHSGIHSLHSENDRHRMRQLNRLVKQTNTIELDNWQQSFRIIRTNLDDCYLSHFACIWGY